MTTPTQIPAGWYDDGSGKQRWWDGQNWGDFASAPTSLSSPANNIGASKTLAILALVGGGVAFLLGLVPVIGALIGLAAIVIGVLALRSRQSKPMSIAGIALGAAATLASIGITIGIAAIPVDESSLSAPIETSQSQAPVETAKPIEPALPTATPTATPTPEPEPEVEAEPEVELEPELTLAQENAVQTAESYLDYAAFSRKGLIDQLEFEDFSTNDAKFAVDYLAPNWNEQAGLMAQSYLDYTSFSRQGLFDQLRFEGFTKKQATHGVKAVGY